jgi:hypothetical protein
MTGTLGSLRATQLAQKHLAFSVELAVIDRITERKSV